MKVVTEQDIRMSFINCSKGKPSVCRSPVISRNCRGRIWTSSAGVTSPLPGAATSSPSTTAALAGITLRFPSQQRGFLHRSMCSLCLTTHPGSGVSLMTARKAGPAGREGNSVGLYMCTDLDCSLYVRGKKAVPSGARFKESLTMEEQIARTTANLSGFVAKLFG